MEETQQLAVVTWNLPKCYVAGLVSLTENDTHKWTGHWEKTQIQRTPHTMRLNSIFFALPKMCGIIILSQFFWSSFSFLKAGMSDSKEILTIFLQDVQQLSFTIFYLWSTVFALLGLKPGSIHTGTADCTFSTLISIIRILFLIIVLIIHI